MVEAMIEMQGKALPPARTVIPMWMRTVVLVLTATAAMHLAAQAPLQRQEPGKGTVREPGKGPVREPGKVPVQERGKGPVQGRGGLKRPDRPAEPHPRHGDFPDPLFLQELAPAPAPEPSPSGVASNLPAGRMRHKPEHHAKPVRELHPLLPGESPIPEIGIRLPDCTRVTFQVGGQTLVRRTSITGGVASSLVYRPWVRRGITFEVFLPSHYYHSDLYARVLQPWSSSVYYRWNWASQPWYQFYGSYGRPAPFYPSPLSWMVDAMVSSTLRDAYQAGLDQGFPMAPVSGPEVIDPLTPVVRQAMADEIRILINQEWAEQQALAKSGTLPPRSRPSLFNDARPRIFLVPGKTGATSGGRKCSLAEGDVLQLVGPPPARSRHADVVLLASRNPMFTRGTLVKVRLQDLQEMQNHMRAAVNQGLDDLQSHQGHDGLPALPAQCLGRSAAPFAGAERETGG